MKRIFVAFALTVLSTVVFSQEVSQWRGPDRTGIYRETGLMKQWPSAGPKLLWQYTGLGGGYSSAAVTSTDIFITGMVDGNGVLYALDHNGKLKWKKEYGREWTSSHEGVRTTPLVIGNRLYLFSSYGQLICMNTANGQIIWSVDTFREYGGRNIQWGVTENLLYDGNVLYCSPGGPDANIIAVDRNTGKLIWKSRGGDEKSAYGSPVLINHGGKKILVAMMEKTIQAYDAASGLFLWKHDHINQYSVHPNPPFYSNGMLYCNSGYGKGGIMLKLSADGKSVTRLWEDPNLDPKIGGFVVLNGKIYGGGDRNRSLFCLDWNSGKVTYSLRDLAPCNIISNDGLLYIYAESGRVALVSPDAGKFNIISTFKVPLGEGPHWAHLVIHNKRLYVRHGSSLMVYDIAAR
ncbi:MAG TPA: PQQ-binding-like beta-propeller repeat protein [Bacteroidales bacterium]|nr:PQQ-binding-like beta-propeller repeat protein [Bacteroidales bacterium]HPF02574.1 PQQ-binding-like beta-propeller repeat protein [Bacteroidales bacterium]HPJ59281.1 PQQ-binding-like beta-propeller repeat protein [Bacteroidales bacterium]HPR11041.1 PQQ-binding-like beta-propeller repeat protein [Bacteroidales bacterium]HRW84432.1 PQQ-binding-like beta-propeller repeat protein [Bacteroidales bacterium]